MDDAWINGITGALGAALGAGVGGYATFHANLRMHERQSEQRAEVRAKSKIYIPVRAELIELRKRVGETTRFQAIARSDEHGRHYATSYFVEWPRMSNDGRALSARRNVRRSLDGLAAKVEEYNSAMADAQKLGDEMYRDACRELFGHEADRRSQQMSDVADIVLEREGDWHFRVWGVPREKQGDPDTAAGRLRAQILGDARAERLRAMATQVEASLLLHLDASVRVLDDVIEDIGERYEKMLTRHA